MPEVVKLLLVMLGGSLGAGARYLVGRACSGFGTDTFPWPTLCINIAGSFLLGVLVMWAKGQPDRAAWLLFLGTGLCGGFTTFSTFSVETLALMEANRWLLASIYVLGSVLAAILGAWLGTRI